MLLNNHLFQKPTQVQLETLNTTTGLHQWQQSKMEHGNFKIGLDGAFLNPFSISFYMSTPGGRIYPVSVPYSSSQNTSKTSVTLSLVMPSQGGTLTNGTNTASTLDGGTPTPGYGISLSNLS